MGNFIFCAVEEAVLHFHCFEDCFDLAETFYLHGKWIISICLWKTVQQKSKSNLNQVKYIFVKIVLREIQEN